MTRRIGILTGGGDCPGLNAVIRAAVKTARGYGWEVLGIRDGFDGLRKVDTFRLSRERIKGILPGRHHPPAPPTSATRSACAWATRSRTSPTRWSRTSSSRASTPSSPSAATAPGHRLEVLPARHPRRGRAQDHRQRPLGHRHHLRLRHGRRDRHPRHRQAAPHRRVP
ncbi:MAG: 6-phosphofructokinase [bacterium]